MTHLQQIQLQDMVKEISMMSQKLQHPSIVGFRGICIDSTLPWLVLEYMPGGSLDHFFRAQRSENHGACACKASWA